MIRFPGGWMGRVLGLGFAISQGLLDTNRDRLMKIKYSCVLDQHPRFGRQAFVWALSLLTYGGAETDSLVIHTVGEYSGEYRKIFDDWGIETRVVTAFDSRHPNSNKLAQFESEALQSVDYAVLFDCDIAFCGDISGWITGESIRGRAGISRLSANQWIELFSAANLQLPAAWGNAVTSATTPASYVNGGFYVIPKVGFQQLRTVWPRWNRLLIERSPLIHPHEEFTDQISFAMSCQELGLTVEHLPVELNLDTVHLTNVPDVASAGLDIHPLVLHYHRLNRQGFVRPAGIPSIDRQVRKINDLIRLAEQVNYHKPSLMLLKERRIAS
jgi:hypothetical protein